MVATRGLSEAELFLVALSASDSVPLSSRLECSHCIHKVGGLPPRQGNTAQTPAISGMESVDFYELFLSNA